MEQNVDRGRRAFLTGRARRPASPPPVRPPWLSEAALAGCTGCDACAQACPTGIVSLHEARPVVSFAAGECTFCGACADACPENLFETARPPFAHVARITSDCLTYSGVECRACGDACPETAIRFRPRIGGPFLPEIRESACTGCGACLAPCPADAVTLSQLPETVDA